ncbi:MAG: 2-dehydropantoate 2-reductase [Actinomycetales bacterium]|nr:2-dehydropantoate 2-reductase [Actinomycetales bacterium]
MRIGIIGTGAMASIFGGGLIGAGHDVVFVGKNPATVSALNTNGLTVDRDGSTSSHYAASATLAINMDPASVGICDIVLVVVKSYDTVAAVGNIGPLVGPNTIVVTLQNGVGAGEIIAKSFPLGQIVQGVTYQGGTILGPGHVYHHSTAATMFGPFTGAGLGAVDRADVDMAAAETVATLWAEAGWKVSVTPAIDAEVWKKVVVNGVNAIAATTLLPSRAMTESPANSSRMSFVRESRLPMRWGTRSSMYSRHWMTFWPCWRRHRTGEHPCCKILTPGAAPRSTC